ncbi:MAG: 30S ribosomal protein S12 methylthiotransferase RimO [Endomicrobiales bacterium]|nr:30S ribosomal protein S12 methylthiotransferase RimO [Endomicrobiales bacterium]
MAFGKNMSNNICLITLGCPKNIVEGESLAGILNENNWNLTTDINKADCVLVHTCAFISEAKKESGNVINVLSKLKKSGKLQRLIVSGCMAQEEGENIFNEFPCVDGIIGTGHLDQIQDVITGKRRVVVNSPGGLLESNSPRLLSTNLVTTYIRIAEGCSHRCSYCLIPALRGPYLSRSMESILREAEELADEGIKELVLISQDTTSYGKDLYGSFKLSELLKKLARIKKLKLIRVLYSYPKSVNDEFIRTLKDEDKICKYLDLPLQHVSNRVLRSMGRPGDIRKLLENIKKSIPDLSLRTTFIVGFPGETENEFRELYDFVSEGWFDHLGVFEYSPHPQIRSNCLSNQVSDSVKHKRKQQLMLLQRKIVNKKNKGRIGATMEVLVENHEKKGNYFVGRSYFQAPEVDSKIFVKGDAKTGEFCRIKITGQKGYDLIGEVIDRR